MTSNISNGTLRIISGLVIAAVSLLVGFTSSTVIAIFCCIISILCSYEYIVFIKNKFDAKWLHIAVISIVTGIIGVCVHNIYITLLLILCFTLLSIRLFFVIKHWQSWFYQYFIILYPTYVMSSLAGHYYYHIDEHLTFIYFMTLIWSSDVGAYYFGKAFGKHHLLKRISPKKTIEGFLGGGLVALITSTLWYMIHPLGSVTTMLLMGGLVWLFSSMGDLQQSQIKRYFGVKDSSNLIPGHGGFFDRYDGFLFAIPVFLLLIQYL